MMPWIHLHIFLCANLQICVFSILFKSPLRDNLLVMVRVWLCNIPQPWQMNGHMGVQDLSPHTKAGPWYVRNEDLGKENSIPLPSYGTPHLRNWKHWIILAKCYPRDAEINQRRKVILQRSYPILSCLPGLNDSIYANPEFKSYILLRVNHDYMQNLMCFNRKRKTKVE